MGPCFFKPLIGDFAQKLLVPPSFVNKFKQKFSSKPLLKCGCEKTYTLKIAELEDRLYFTNGWQEFVKDHKLEVGDFIIFRLIADVVFEVLIYDPTMCEKFCCQQSNHGNTPDQPVKIETSCSSEGDRSDKACGRMKNPEKEIEIERDEDDSNNDDEPETDDASSSFKLVLNESHKIDLPLPTSFVSKALLAGNSEIVLRDPTGKKWPSKISEGTKKIVHLTGGWIGLYIANKLKKGDTCIFKCKRSEESSSNNLQVIQVKVKRGRGRPPKIGKHI